MIPVILPVLGLGIAASGLGYLIFRKEHPKKGLASELPVPRIAPAPQGPSSRQSPPQAAPVNVPQVTRGQAPLSPIEQVVPFENMLGSLASRGGQNVADNMMQQQGGAIIAPTTTIVGTPRTVAQSASFEKSKRQNKEYYMWAQDALNKVFLPSGAKKLGVDGQWGPMSTQRAKDYQKSRGNLQVDGIVGENTEFALVSDGAGKGVPEPPWARA